MQTSTRECKGHSGLTLSICRAHHSPACVLFADPEGVCYKVLGFHPGFASDASMSPYLKLLVMLAGVGSPGTIQEVPLLTQSVMAMSHVKI